MYDLRKQAEALLEGKPVELEDLSAEDAQRLIHELQVHQIELKLQNENLQQAQQEIEISRNKYADLYDFAPVGYFTIDANGVILEANLTAAAMLGVERSALLNRPLSSYISRDSQDIYYLSQRALFTRNVAQACQIKLIKKGGQEFHAYLEGIVVSKRAQNVSQGRLTISDITERITAEEGLRESERRYKNLLEAVTDYIYTVQIEQGQAVSTTHSPGCVAVTGYTSQEYATDPDLWYRMIHEADRRMVMKRISKVLNGEQISPFEHRIIHKDKRVRWVKNTWVPRYDEAGRLVAYEGLISDVTERKQAEEELVRERNLLRALADNLPDHIYVKDTEGRFLLVNEAVRKHLGAASIEDVLGRTDFDFSPLELAEQYQADEQQIFETDQPLISHEEKIYDHTRRGYRWVSATKVPFHDSQSQIIGLVGLNRDITTLKEVEAALRQSEAFNQAVLDSLTAHIAVLDKYGTITAVNEAWERFGRNNGNRQPEKIGVGANYLRVCERVNGKCAPEAKQARQGIEAVLNGELADFTLEYACHSPRQERWFLMMVAPLTTDLEGAVVSHVEITDRKRIEEALRESETRYRAIVEDQTEFICRFRPGGILTFINEAYARYLGQGYEQLIGRSFLPLVPEGEREKVEKSLAALNKEKPVISHEHRVVLPGGEVRWQRWTNRLIFDEQQNPVEIQAVGRDVTERKQAEEALRQSQARLDAIINTATDAIITIDESQHIILVNIAAARILHYPVEEVIGQPLNILLPDRFRAKHINKVNRFGQSNVTARQMATHEDLWGLRANGEEFPVEAMISQVEVTGQKFYTVILRDVTERRRAEEALKMHARVLESMVEGVNVSDERGIIHFTNSAFDKMFGYRTGELIGQHVSILEVEQPGGKAQNLDEIVVQLEREGVWSGEFSNRRKDDTHFITSAHISLLEMPDRRYRVSVQEDITDRRRAEQETARLFEAVNRQREQLRALTRRLTDIQEAERKQLARELHDQVGQNLTALGLNLNLIRAQIPDDNSQALLLYNRIDDSLMLTEQTTERIRDVMANLRPPVLDDYGLLAALRWYGKRFSSWGGFTVSVVGDELEPRAAPSVENTLFRIAQEAMTNVAKHAQATKVKISIDKDDTIMRMVIEDNGRGFDTSFLSESTRRQGWGLLSMMERAETINGHCIIESTPGQGTRIIVEVSQ